MSQFQKNSLLAGMFVLFSAALGILYEEAIMVMIFILFVPGPLFILIISIFKRGSIFQKIIFFIVASFYYYLIVKILSLNIEDSQLWPFRITAASIVGAIVLQAIFDIIFRSITTIKNTFIKPGWNGLLASALPTASAFIFEITSPSQISNFFIFGGIFSIFPIWFNLFIRHLVRTNQICK